MGLLDPNNTCVNGDLAVAQQSFLLADTMTGFDEFVGTPMNGIMGLSQAWKSGGTGTPFYLNLYEQGQIREPIFSIFISQVSPWPLLAGFSRPCSSHLGTLTERYPAG